MTERYLPRNTTAQKILLRLLRGLMKLLLRFEVSHAENIPSAGPLVVIINHIAWLDPVMVLGGFSRVVIPMAKRESFDWFLVGPMIKMYGAIPVRRGQADVDAIKSALKILKACGAVLLAPEGTRSQDHQLQRGKEGAAMIALRSEAVIVPVGVTGTHEVAAHWKRLKRSPVRLSVGKPFRLRSLPGKGRSRRSGLDAATHEMMVRLARQLPAEFRGVYRNLGDAPETHLTPVEIDVQSDILDP